jgi:formyltetrahydrofolate synthetase
MDDLHIARAATLKPLDDVASALGIGPHLLEPYGEHVAKVKLTAIEELADRPRAKYVVVTAVTPTPLGEGKTATTVGLGQAFAHFGFVYPLCGDMRTMPGLGADPAAAHIDIDADGEIVGLF